MSALFDVHLRVNVNVCMNSSAHSTKHPTLGKPNTSENRTIGAVRRGFGLDRFDCIFNGNHNIFGSRIFDLESRYH